MITAPIDLPIYSATVSGLHEGETTTSSKQKTTPKSYIWSSNRKDDNFKRNQPKIRKLWEIPPYSTNSNSELCPPRVKVSSHSHLGRFNEIVHVRDSLVGNRRKPLPSHDGSFGKAGRIGENGGISWKCWGNSLMKPRKKQKLHWFWKWFLKFFCEIRNDMGLLWSFYAWAQRPSALLSKRYSRALRLTPQ